MSRDRLSPVFSRAYRDTGYIFGRSAYTCCHNCTRRKDCPKKPGNPCTKEQSTCISCSLWSEQGCRHFVLDWGVLKI